MSRGKTLIAEISLIVALVALGVAGRMLPHPANFTPIAATALLAGFLLRSRWLAVAVPLGAMAISDFFDEAVDLRIRAAIYLALATPVLLAGILKARFTGGRLVGCSLAGSLVFFVVTNAAVWLFSPRYTPDVAGLLECFTAAIPFARNTIAGDLIWTVVLFGTYGLLTNSLRLIWPRRAYAKVRKR
jgi:hypothetical protein